MCTQMLWLGFDSSAVTVNDRSSLSAFVLYAQRIVVRGQNIFVSFCECWYIRYAAEIDEIKIGCRS